MAHAARDVVYLGEQSEVQPATYLSDEEITSALMRLQVMEAQANGRNLIALEKSQEIPEELAKREEAVAILHTVCADLEAQLAQITSQTAENPDTSSIGELEAALSNAQAQLLSAMSSGVNAGVVLANAKAFSASVNQVSSNAKSANEREHNNELAEKYSDAYVAVRAKLDAEWKQWEAKQEEVFGEVRTLADKYGIDITPFEERRATLQEEIEKEQDPVKKARLRVDLAAATLDASKYTLAELKRMKAEGLDVSDADIAVAEANVAKAEQILDESQALLGEEIDAEQLKLKAEQLEAEAQLTLRQQQYETALQSSALPDELALLQADMDASQQTLTANAAKRAVNAEMADRTGVAGDNFSAAFKSGYKTGELDFAEQEVGRFSELLIDKTRRDRIAGEETHVSRLVAANALRTDTFAAASSMQTGFFAEPNSSSLIPPSFSVGPAADASNALLPPTELIAKADAAVLPPAAANKEDSKDTPDAAPALQVAEATTEDVEKGPNAGLPPKPQGGAEKTVG